MVAVQKDYKRIRHEFCPDRIDYLWIAESPPPNPENYFYQGNKKNSFTRILLDATNCESPRVFQQKGHFLVESTDFCIDGVFSKIQCENMMAYLAETHFSLQTMVLFIGQAARNMLKNVLIYLGYENLVDLPFANHWWEKKFKEEMKKRLI